MKKKNVFTVIAGVLLGIFFAGCAVTDHTDDAVEKARKFALDKTRTLTEYERNTIRYTLPAIQEEDIFTFNAIKLTEYDHVPRGENVKVHKTEHLDHQAVSFVWNIPSIGSEVVVYGTGDRSMRFWEPVRVLFRKREKVDSAYEAAMKKVQDFTINNMLYLTESERTRIRFSPGKVYCTTFDLSYLQEKKAPAAENVWQEYLNEKKSGKKARFQLSLIWQADDPQKVIVFTGTGAFIPGAKEEKLPEGKITGEKEISLLASWDILCVHVLKKDEFAKYTAALDEVLKIHRDQEEK
ncbi:MAG: hypothetical protein J6S53_02355 [Lentisphaeria bacterium]|nr:hypothetical protein [Lentisphaeria bacterium]